MYIFHKKRYKLDFGHVACSLEHYSAKRYTIQI